MNALNGSQFSNIPAEKHTDWKEKRGIMRIYMNFVQMDRMDN